MVIKTKVLSILNPLTYGMLLIGLLCFSQTSFALDKQGHKVVCQLAFENLTPSSQTKVTKILALLSREQKKLINQYNNQSTARYNEQANISFADSCTWADAIKKQKAYQKFKTWHYINVSRSATSVSKSSCKNDCITQAIILHKQQLHHSTHAKEKLEALMFLGHWLGDIHQPLHVSFSSDYGGNKNKIKLKRVHCNNLHWLWDECLLNQIALELSNTRKKTSRKKKQQSLVDMFNLAWEKEPTSIANSWHSELVYQWASESLQLTRDQQLYYCKLLASGECISLADNVIQLPLNYQQQFSPVLQKQIILAAKRLSLALEDAL
jgi:hypothetical protein